MPLRLTSISGVSIRSFISPSRSLPAAMGRALPELRDRSVTASLIEAGVLWTNAFIASALSFRRFIELLKFGQQLIRRHWEPLHPHAGRMVDSVRDCSGDRHNRNLTKTLRAVRPVSVIRFDEDHLRLRHLCV